MVAAALFLFLESVEAAVLGGQLVLAKGTLLCALRHCFDCIAVAPYNPTGFPTEFVNYPIAFKKQITLLFQLVGFQRLQLRLLTNSTSRPVTGQFLAEALVEKNTNLPFHPGWTLYLEAKSPGSR